MTLVAQAWQYALVHQHALWLAVRGHTALAGAALAIAAAICVPLGIWTSRHEAGPPTIALVNAARVIPSLAVLTLMQPIFGLGFAPSLVALTLLACPPILINTDVGYRGVEPAAIEAARGMGMLSRQVLRRVETPLALPVMLTGVRTAAVEVIASATLASFIGGGGLGDLIVQGLQVNDMGELVAGAAAVALLALAAEVVLGAVQRLASSPGLRESA